MSSLTRKELKSAIIGMVLGDGHLCQNRFKDGIYRGNALFKCSHGQKQGEYLEWKKNFLQNLFDYDLKVKNRMMKTNWGKEFFAYELVTRVHPRLTQIFKLFYRDKKKIVTRKILDKLTPLGLAIWYMDDGFLSHNRKKQWKVVGLCTNSFSYGENILIRDWFKERWDIDFNILKKVNEKRYGGRTTYYLRRGLSEGYKLLEIVKPYVEQVNCMKYKIDFNFYPRGYYNLKIQNPTPYGVMI